jgi:polysaccharide pyruvyl transferase WcaK-like protein
LGTFGYGNLGDAAIQDAVIQNIGKALPGAVIYGYSLNPEDTERRHGIRSFPISRINWRTTDQQTGITRVWQQFSERLRSSDKPAFQNLERWLNRLPIEAGLIAQAYRSLAGVDALIISGGGQLDDYWGGGGPWSHPYTLLKWGLLARLRGARYLFVSVGAGPIDASLSKVFIRWALRLAQYRSYRDPASRRLVEGIGGPQGDPVYPDLAFSLKHPDSSLHRRDSRLAVGVGPIGFFKHGCWPEFNDSIYAAYLEKMASLVAWLLENDYTVTYLVGESHYDRLAIEDLKQTLAAAGVFPTSDQVFEPPIETVEDITCLLASLDLVVASRLHTLLLAQVAGKPAIALSYQSKIDELMAGFGQGSYCFPVDQFDAEQVKERFVSLAENRNAITGKIAEITRTRQVALEEQYERIFHGL